MVRLNNLYCSLIEMHIRKWKIGGHHAYFGNKLNERPLTVFMEASNERLI